METLQACDFYLLRLPVKPVEALIAFNDGVNRHGEAYFAAGLKQVFSEPAHAKAIYVASPELYRGLRAWLDGETTDPKKGQKLLQSLYKYLIRMSSRCTPYGLFAGCTTGTIGNDASAFRFAGGDYRRTHSRLDMNYVAELNNYFNALPDIAAQLRYYPNDTLYRVGERYRYVEYALKDKHRTYKLTAVKESRYVTAVLRAAAGGATPATLTAALVAEGITAGQAEAYLRQVIAAQLLVSELYPTVTGEEYFPLLIEKLRTLAGGAPYADRLARVQALLQDPNSSVAEYERVKGLVNGLIPTQSKDLVQTDLFYETTAHTLNRRVTGEIMASVTRLARLGTRYENKALEEFKKKFTARYEAQEVPLLMALDAENGIGYGLSVGGTADYMPLLQDLAVFRKGSDPQFTWDGAGKVLFRKIKEAIGAQQPVVALTDDELDEVEDRNVLADLPPSTYLFGNLLAPSCEALDEGQFTFVLDGVTGPSAGNLLARFCHGSPGLSARVKACLEAEAAAYPNQVLAEIVHLPESRVGNILMRPLLRPYEISFLGKPSVDEAHCISLQDLRVSVRNDRVILRSERLGKEILPRLTNAHNFTRGLALYRFLCDLQFQGTASIFNWNWSVFYDEPFLPRLTYKKIILHRARWLLRKKDFLPRADDPQGYDFLQGRREALRIPRWVVLREGDNELLIDFDNRPSLGILADTLRKRDAELCEFLATPDQCFVEGPGGHYANEVIIPLQRESAAKPPAPPRPEPARERPPVVREFGLGSEWLYVKIYTGNKSADRVLTEVVSPLARQLTASGVVDRWFYIRYYDPDPHLRVRFHGGGDPGYWKTVLDALQAALRPYVENGLVVKLVTDTYQRELERYGDTTMELSEALFWSDSLAVAGFLDLIEGDEGERYRWLFALRNVDALLDDFGYPTERKRALLQFLRDAFYGEFSGGSRSERLLHSLNDKYRADAKAVQGILAPGQDEELAEAVACFAERSERNRGIAARIAAALAGDGSSPAVTRQRLDDLLGSYIHMTLNRTFLARQRMHELVVYHYLAKYYESQLARQKAGAPKRFEAVPA